MVNGGRETNYNVWQLSRLESLKTKTSFDRGIHSVLTGELLPTKNMVGAGKTRVHRQPLGSRGPRT